MEILVTGGCGFIGSHLVDRLVADGHRVRVLDNLSTGKRENLNPAATLNVGDVADTELVQALSAMADAVFHLAAVASVEACRTDWLASHRTNLTGTVTVLDAAARARRIPVIYASSAAIYGDNPALPLAETATPSPRSAYGLDKLSAEHYANIAWEFHGVPSTGLRFFNVYGPRQDPSSPYSGVISKFMSNAEKNLPLTFFGDGEQTRDFIYVGDIVDLLMAAWQHVHGANIYNGCTGNRTSLKELAAAVGVATGTSPTTTHAEARAGDIRHSAGSPHKATAELGFTATTPLAQGLAALAAHA